MNVDESLSEDESEAAAKERFQIIQPGLSIFSKKNQRKEYTPFSVTL